MWGSWLRSLEYQGPVVLVPTGEAQQVVGTVSDRWHELAWGHGDELVTS